MMWRISLLVLMCQFSNVKASTSTSSSMISSVTSAPSVKPFDLSYVAQNGTSHIINRCEVARKLRKSCTQHPNVTEGYCLSQGCCWDSTHDEIGTHCYHMDVAVSRFKPNEYVAEDPFCPAANGTYLLGDVNGDGEGDQFCKIDGNIFINLGDADIPYENTTTASLDGCSGGNDVVQTGDVNGDGRSDIVCVTENGGIMVWISEDWNLNFYNFEPWKDEHFEFCGNDKGSMKISDFNGDGIEDLLCAPKTADRKRSLALGEKSGTFRAPVTDPNFQGFCNGTKDQLKFGDFDADERTDLVCRVEEGSFYQIALTDGDGLLVNEDFRTEETWCDQAGDTFLVGDFNGDHHDDWICHHSDGSVCVKYNSHIFADGNMFKLESCDNINVCSTGDLNVEDYNADGMDDLYCHGEDGNTSVTSATVKAPLVDFLQTDWDSDVAWNNSRFCKDKELYVGDVNGDERGDVICHENKGGLMQRILGNHYGQLIYSDKWPSSGDSDNVARFCHSTHKDPEYPKLLQADVNGDGRIDVLCHSHLTGDVDVIFSDPDGTFRDETTLKASFCQGHCFRLSAADFNADGKVDLICKSSTETKIWLQDGKDPVTLDSSWCTNLFDEILVGRFVNGRSDDMMCHCRKTGEKSILHVTSQRVVDIEYVNEHNNWCLSKDKKQLKAGDFNGDKLTDLLCHQEDGTMHILLNQADHRSYNSFFGETFIAAVKFCLEPGSTLSVYDANGDRYDDLICHSSTGRITISESHLVAEHTSENFIKEWMMNPIAYYPSETAANFHWEKGMSKDGDPSFLPEYFTKFKKTYSVDLMANWTPLGVRAPAYLNNQNCSTGFSIAFWIYSQNGQGYILSASEKTTMFDIGISGFPGKYIYVQIYHEPSYFIQAAIAPDEWNHIVITLRAPELGPQVKLYTRKETQDAKTMPKKNDRKGAYFIGDIPFVLGNKEGFANRDFNDWFLIDELMFWNKTLTGKETEKLFSEYT